MILLLGHKCYCLLIWYKCTEVNCCGYHFSAFLLNQQLRLRWTSVVFDFNASLIDDAPMSPITLSDKTVKSKNKWLKCAFCAYSIDQVSKVFCSSTTQHSMTSLQCFQYSCLLLWWWWKRVTYYLRMLFVSCLLHKLSSVRVVFDCNAWLNDVAPISSIWLSILYCYKKTL